MDRRGLQRAPVSDEHHERDVTVLLQRLAGQTEAVPGWRRAHRHVRSSVWDRGSWNHVLKCVMQWWQWCGSHVMKLRALTFTGHGVWTWADRHDWAVLRCVDLADGMFFSEHFTSSIQTAPQSRCCVFFFYSGGHIKRDDEWAGVHSVSRRQYTCPWTDAVSQQSQLLPLRLQIIQLCNRKSLRCVQSGLILTVYLLFCSYHWQRHEGTVALYVVQDPERKRPWASPIDSHTPTHDTFIRVLQIVNWFQHWYTPGDFEITAVTCTLLQIIIMNNSSRCLRRCLGSCPVHMSRCPRALNHAATSV